MDSLPFNVSEFDEMRVLRSKLIDSYALAERSLCIMCSALGLPAKNELIGQRIERIRKVSANNRYSKDRRATVHTALDRLQDLLAVRNFIVHAHMQELRLDDGSCYAAFRILRAVEPEDANLLTLSLVQFQAIDELVVKLTSELRIY